MCEIILRNQRHEKQKKYQTIYFIYYSNKPTYKNKIRPNDILLQKTKRDDNYNGPRS